MWRSRDRAGDDVADQVAALRSDLYELNRSLGHLASQELGSAGEAAARGAGRLYAQVESLLGSLRNSGADLAETAGRRSASAYRGAEKTVERTLEDRTMLALLGVLGLGLLIGFWSRSGK
jgi:hypothetical protein